MQLAGMRTFALIAAAALVANAYCYAKCATTAADSAQAPSGSCHHHEPSHQDTGCPSQHPEFAGPDFGIAKINLAMTPLFLAVLTTDSRVVFTQAQLPSQRNPGSPPGSNVGAVSVLRI